MRTLLRHSLVAIGLWVVCGRSASAQTAAAPNACLTCHAGQADVRLAAPTTLFQQADVHRESGFRCVECHGGDGESSDARRAHDPGRGFRGVPSGQAQIGVCSRCHSDAEVMRRFAPRQRVDQATEYVTSVHGKRLASGDSRVATCASCHGAHGIRRVNDAKSPVFPTNVAATCGGCHADATRMSGYKLDNGSPLPVVQLSDYQKSVHYAALTRGNDLSAPTCNDCHGNHGAAPPGVGAVANVCGTCHAVFQQKFAASVHAQIFDKGCVECHGNHAVLKPSDDLLGAGSQSLCAMCHTGADDKGAAAASAMHGALDRLKTGIDRSSALVSRLKNAGMEMGSQELALSTARSQLTLVRTEVHAFDATRVTPIADAGLKIVGDVNVAGGKAVAELQFRRRGLAASLGAILLVVVALGLKIRQIDRRQSERG